MNSVVALRLVFVVFFAALQTLLLHLAASIVLVAFGGGLSISWTALLLTALVAAWAVRRWEPVDQGESFVRRPTLLVCAATVVYAAKIHLGGGWNPLSGWLLIWPFVPDGPNVLAWLIVLIAGLWAWWRGMELPDSDHGDVVRTLQSGVLFVVLLLIVITPLSEVNLGAPPWGTLFAIEGVTAIACGLLALSLSRIEAVDSGTPASRWRMARSGILATTGLVGAGLLVLALVSSAATAAVRGVIFVLATALAFLLSPLVEPIYRLLLAMRGDGDASEQPPVASTAAQASAPPSAADGLDVRIFEVLVSILGVLLYLLPLVVLILAILLMQRRRRKVSDVGGAQHESLWSWRAFAGDVRGLLNGILVRRGSGLRDALARLRGDDPARRIRRRYVEALLLGETAQRERMPEQTPLEFQPQLSSVTPQAGAEVATLTESYDRARYAPETIQPADADRADAAWEAIRRSPKDAP